MNQFEFLSAFEYMNNWTCQSGYYSIYICRIIKRSAEWRDEIEKKWPGHLHLHTHKSTHKRFLHSSKRLKLRKTISASQNSNTFIACHPSFLDTSPLVVRCYPSVQCFYMVISSRTILQYPTFPGLKWIQSATSNCLPIHIAVILNSTVFPSSGPCLSDHCVPRGQLDLITFQSTWRW